MAYPHDHDHHGHDHSGHGHSHAPSADADRRWLAVALGLVATFMVVEVVAGLLSGSLALLSDAAHMLTDTAALALALVAAHLATRPPSRRFTFGLGRAEILSAQLNGATLLVLSAVIAVEAIGRLSDPEHIDGWTVIVVGGTGALVNVLAAWSLSRSERQSLNIRGAYAHVLGDLFGSIAAIVAGVGVVAWGFEQADGIAALVVSLLLLRSGWTLVRDSGRVLLEAAPRGMDVGTIGDAMAHHKGVVEVHDLHVWEVTTGFPALAAHVLVAPGDDCHRVRRELQALVRERYGIAHTTLQVDHERQPELLDIAPTPGAR